MSASKHRTRVETIVRSQRHAAPVIVAMLVTYCLVWCAPFLIVVNTVLVAVMLRRLIRLMAVLDKSRTWRVSASICLFIPFAQLIVVAVANHQASEVLRAAGLRVGTFGVSDDELRCLDELMPKTAPPFPARGIAGGIPD